MKLKIIATVMFIALFSQAAAALPPKDCGLCWAKVQKLLANKVLPVQLNDKGTYTVDLTDVQNSLANSGLKEKMTVELLLGKNAQPLLSYTPTSNSLLQTNIKPTAELSSTGKQAGVLVIKDSFGNVKLKINVQLVIPAKR